MEEVKPNKGGERGKAAGEKREEKKRPPTRTQRVLIKQTLWAASAMLDKLFQCFHSADLSEVLSLFSPGLLSLLRRITHTSTQIVSMPTVACPSKDIWLKKRERGRQIESQTEQ